MIKFISQNDEWISSMKRLFQKVPNVYVDKVDIRTIPRDSVCFVLPTNSFGLVNDNYDYIVRNDIFPGSDTIIKQKIKEVGILSVIGSYHIPVGSTITIPYKTSHLLIAPVMIATEETINTNNAYMSFLATLHSWEKLHKDTGKWYNLIVTNHCYNMPGSISAEQMKEAYDEYIRTSYALK